MGKRQNSIPMPRKKCSEEQIIYALHSVEAGAKIGDVCRQLGLAEQMYDRWRKQYDGFGVSELRRLKPLEEESSFLKRLVANQSLDKRTLQAVLAKKSEAVAQVLDRGLAGHDLRGQQSPGVPAAARRVELMASPGGEGPLCAAAATEGADLHPGTLQLPPPDDPAPAGRMVRRQEAALPAVSPGEPLRAHQTREKQAAQTRMPQAATTVNQRRSMDFMPERFENGVYFQVLTIIDQ